jgi:flagellar biosynthesis chaperone FliJ
MTTTLESVKPSFEKLKIKLKEMTENTLKVDVKQKEIINQANEINNILSNSINNNITDHKVINAAEEKIKELKNRIEKSRGKIALIKDKLKKLKDINAKKEIILDN